MSPKQLTHWCKSPTPTLHPIPSPWNLLTTWCQLHLYSEDVYHLNAKNYLHRALFIVKAAWTLPEFAPIWGDPEGKMSESLGESGQSVFLPRWTFSLPIKEQETNAGQLNAFQPWRTIIVIEYNIWPVKECALSQPQISFWINPFRTMNVTLRLQRGMSRP